MASEKGSKKFLAFRSSDLAQDGARVAV
jgi:hypothetical protein